MKLRILDYTFFEYFKTCPTKALYSFNMDFALSNGKIAIKQDKTKEVYRFELIERILKLAIITIKKENTLTYEDFKLMAQSELKEALGKEENVILETIKDHKGVLTEKQKVITEIEEDLLDDIYDLIQTRDFMSIENYLISDYMEINELIERPSEAYSMLGTNYKLTKKYFYEFDIPFITSNSNQHTLIKFTRSGIPNVFEEFDYDLAITLWIAREMFPLYTFKDIIIYDLKTLKRQVLSVNEIRTEFLIDDLFKRFVMLDSGMCFRNYGEHCVDCMNNSACYSSIIKSDVFSKIHDSKVKGKNLNELEKRELIRNSLKYHAKKGKEKGV